MAFKFANFAKTTLSVSASDVDVVLHVPPAEVGDFPVLGVGDKFSAVLYDGIQEPEIVYVTAASGGDLTVERSREDTAAKTWQVGTALAQVLTRDTISYIGGGMSDDTVLHLEERIDGAYAAVTIEATARVTADSAMASLITTVTASVADNTAQIQTIALAQSDLNSAFASLSTTVTATANNALAIATSTATAFSGFQTAQAAINNSVQAQIDDAVASVSTEISARVAGDTALASSITTLNARVGSAEAAITAETTARVDAVAAVASTVTTLTATVGTNTAAITSESLTRATADSALATQIDTLEATVTSDYATLTAAITSESTVRASADSALATRATTLEAQMANTSSSGLQSRISTEETTRASADSTLASSITSLTSTVTGNYSTLSAAISSESTTRASADTALASRATTLEAQMANTSGSGLQSRIATEETARANGDSTNASAISTVSSTVSGLSATVTTHTSTLANLTGYTEANYSVGLDADGAFAGFSLKAVGGGGTSGTVSDAKWRVGHFYILAPTGTTSFQPFDYDSGTGTLLLQNLTLSGNLIVNGTINGIKIAANAVSDGAASTGGNSGTLTTSGWHTVDTVNFTTTGGRIDVAGSVNVNGYFAEGGIQVDIRIVRGATVVGVGSASPSALASIPGMDPYISGGTVTLIPDDAPSAGNYDWDLQVAGYAGNTVYYSQTKIKVQEFKK